MLKLRPSRTLPKSSVLEQARQTMALWQSFKDEVVSSLEDGGDRSAQQLLDVFDGDGWQLTLEHVKKAVNELLAEEHGDTSSYVSEVRDGVYGMRF